MEEIRDNYLIEGSLLKGLLLIAAPIIATNLLQSIMEVVDLFFVGRLGAEAIAGVAVSLTLIMVLMTVIIGINTATTALVSRHFGAGEPVEAGKVLTNAILLGIVFAVVISVIGIIFSDDLLMALGAEEIVVGYGADYINILFAGLAVLVTMWIAMTFFQGCGDSRTPMYVVIFTNGINIVTDPLLIFGMYGFPELGVAGASLATVSSRFIGMLVIIYLLLRRYPEMDFSSHLRGDLHTAKQLITIGVPAMIQTGMRSITFLAIMAIVAMFGTAALSAYGIVNRLEIVFLMPGFGIAMGTAVIVGQNLGAGRPDRAEKGVLYSLLAYGVFMAAVSAVLIIFGSSIMGFFDPSGTSTPIGISYFATVCPFYLLLAVSVILSFAMNGAGDTKTPMYAVLVSMVMVQIPLAYLLSAVAGMGITGIWTGMVIGLFVMTAMLSYSFMYGGWREVKI